MYEEGSESCPSATAAGEDVTCRWGAAWKPLLLLLAASSTLLPGWLLMSSSIRPSGSCRWMADGGQWAGQWVGLALFRMPVEPGSRSRWSLGPPRVT